MPSEDYANIADLYDVYVNTDFDIPYWLELAKSHPGEILDLMCGTGRETLPLVEAGYTVTAIDNSPELLAVLRQKLDGTSLQCDVVQADVRAVDLGKQFDLVILPFNAFAEIQSGEDQLRALKAIHKHLKADGLFVCTLHNPPVRLQSVDGQLRFVASQPLPDDGKLLFWIRQQYHEAEKRVSVMQFYEEYDRHGEMQRKRLLEMSFSIIENDTFEKMAMQAGFRVVDCFGSYDESPFDAESSPFMIWHLGK